MTRDWLRDATQRKSRLDTLLDEYERYAKDVVDERRIAAVNAFRAIQAIYHNLYCNIDEVKIRGMRTHFEAMMEKRLIVLTHLYDRTSDELEVACRRRAVNVVDAMLDTICPNSDHPYTCLLSECPDVKSNKPSIPR